MLTNMRLQNFRSYKDGSFEFSDGVNIIVGPNASGKTNLLEAILVLSTGGSYRAKDSELIRFGQKWARIDSDLINENKRIVKFKNETFLEKVFEIDSNSYRRLSAQKSIPLVVFEPNHLLLLTGSPERRRDYLDKFFATNYTWL